MKIIHISHLYHPSIGGNQLHNQLMSEQLAQLGDQVSVFTTNVADAAYFDHPPDGKFLPARERLNGVNIHRFPINYKFNRFVFKRLYARRGGVRLFKWLTQNGDEFFLHGPNTLGMLPAIAKIKPDIVLATNNYYCPAYLCHLAKKFSRFKFVFMPITHVCNPWRESPQLKPVFKRADLIVACTEHERQYLIGTGIDPKRIVALPLGINSQELAGGDGAKAKKKYGLSGDGPIVGYIGRKASQKGIEMLIKAMPQLWRDIPNAQLFLAGHLEGYFAPVLEKALSEIAPEQRSKIININDFPAQEKKDLFSAIDVLAMPSVSDCFGIVYLEAWACGKPVIACKNTPQESIITDGHDGVLVDFDNTAQLAEALKEILQNGDLKKKLGENGYHSVTTKFDLDAYGKNLRKEYSKLLA